MRLRAWAMVTAVVVASWGCDDDGGQTEDAGVMLDGGNDMGGPGVAAYTIRFAGRFGAVPAVCGTKFGNVGRTRFGVELLDFRFYVHDINLVTADGEAVPLSLDQDGMWQVEDVALLDFEDGTAGCSESGNGALRDVVVGLAPVNDYVGLRFSLGVPPELNHGDTTTAPAPLNIGSMFWVWQSGYKFLRLDIANENPPPDNNWFVHLGSGGCVADDPNTAPTEACMRPNRPTIELDDFDPEADIVIVDAAALLAGADVGTNTPMTPPGCMSNPVDVDECPAVFENLGLDWDTGDCVDGCAGQAFFRVAGAE